MQAFQADGLGDELRGWLMVTALAGEEWLDMEEPWWPCQTCRLTSAGREVPQKVFICLQIFRLIVAQRLNGNSKARGREAKISSCQL